MTKQEFNELEVLEQLEYINNELAAGKSLRNIADNLSMSKTTFRDRALKIGYTYNADISRYDKDNTIVIQLDKSITKEPQKSKERAITTTREGNTKELQKYDNDILELAKYKDELLEMLKNYKSNTKVTAGSTLDINSLPWEMKKDIVNKSIKVYEPVYKAFDELCNSYSSYKKQDLISMAILEFCNKYKK